MSTSRRSEASAPDWSWLAEWPDLYRAPGDMAMVGWYYAPYDFALAVYGRPAPQGSKRHVGKGVMVESSPHVKPWREAVRASAIDAMELAFDGPGTDRLYGPVAVRMIFTLAVPASAKPGARPAVMPDVSKLVRATEDALVDAGVLADDKLIVEYDRVAKVYPNWDPESLDRPGAVVKIRRLT